MLLRSTNASKLGALGGALIALVVAVPVPVSASTTTTSATIAPLGWLSVSHPARAAEQIVDSAGRTVILRGVNLVGLEDDFYQTPTGAEPGPAPFWSLSSTDYAGKCPANSELITEPPVCEVQAGRAPFDQSDAAGAENDFAQMRALGFNVVRLAISWSQLEPTPGQYSATYLNRIAQVVSWAGAQGIYVLVDMHEDSYSRFTPETAPTLVPGYVAPTIEGGNHADGAPQWAVDGDGVPAESVEGEGELNTFVETAFTNFWLNAVPTNPLTHQPLPQGEAPGAGLQDHYIGALAAVVRRFKNDPAVVGYEIMNEPLPGLIAAPGVFDQGYLYPFYRRVIDALTGTSDGARCPTSVPYVAACGYRNLGVNDRRHLFFFEPCVLRNLTDVAVGLSLPFSSYPNLVYAPHVYTHVFTVDTDVPDELASSLYPLGYGQALITARAEARSLGAALFIGEFGNSNNDDNTILASETKAIDQAGVSSTLWSWKGNCSPGQSYSSCNDGLWSMFDADPSAHPTQNEGIIATRLHYVSRVYPRATAGTLDSFAYQPDSGTFTMTATSATAVTAGDLGAETTIYIPPTVHGVVTVTGAARLDEVVTRPDASRVAYVEPTGGGAYGVDVGA